MGRSIYFTSDEIDKLIEYVNYATEMLSVEDDDTFDKTNYDVTHSLGSALKKLRNQPKKKAKKKA